MHSPSTNFDRHERTIQELIIKAYEQCKRFVDYLDSAEDVPIYTRSGSEFRRSRQIRQRDYRLIVPIGLTIESFTPFSAMCKEFPEIRPTTTASTLLYRCRSTTCLYLTQFLPTAGELLHYLEVRQAVAGIQRAMLFDEIDHLGAYISQNRVDVTTSKNNLKEADMIRVMGLFRRTSWTSTLRMRPRAVKNLRTRSFPRETSGASACVSTNLGPEYWLALDAHIRNLGGDARTNFARVFSELQPTLQRYPRRRFVMRGRRQSCYWFGCVAKVRSHQHPKCVITVKPPRHERVSDPGAKGVP